VLAIPRAQLEAEQARTLARVSLALLAGPEREQELKTAIVDGLAPYRSRPGLPALERVPLPDRKQVSTFAVMREAGPGWQAARARVGLAKSPCEIGKNLGGRRGLFLVDR
jgi:hypothetical protein